MRQRESDSCACCLCLIFFFVRRGAERSVKEAVSHTRPTYLLIYIYMRIRLFSDTLQAFFWQLKSLFEHKKKTPSGKVAFLTEKSKRFFPVTTKNNISCILKKYLK